MVTEIGSSFNASDNSGCNNPFLDPLALTAAAPVIEENPFMEDSNMTYSNPNFADRTRHMTTKNRIMEKLDPSVTERIESGEGLSLEEALMLTITGLRERTENLEEKEEHLLRKIKELEELAEDKETEIKALEFTIRQNDAVNGKLPPPSLPKREGKEDSIIGDEESIVEEPIIGRKLLHQRMVSTSVFALDVALQDGGPPPKLTATFGRANFKLRRAKAEAAGSNNLDFLPEED